MTLPHGNSKWQVQHFEHEMGFWIGLPDFEVPLTNFPSISIADLYSAFCWFAPCHWPIDLPIICWRTYLCDLCGKNLLCRIGPTRSWMPSTLSNNDSAPPSPWGKHILHFTKGQLLGIEITDGQHELLRKDRKGPTPVYPQLLGDLSNQRYPPFGRGDRGGPPGAG